jgi:hypothetical protein
MVKKLESSEFFTFFYESDFEEPVMVEELKVLIENKLGQDPEPIIVGKDNQKYLSFDWDKGYKLLNVYHLKEGFMVRYYDGNGHQYYLCNDFDELEIIISEIVKQK